MAEAGAIEGQVIHRLKIDGYRRPLGLRFDCDYSNSPG